MQVNVINGMAHVLPNNDAGDSCKRQQSGKKRRRSEEENKPSENSVQGSEQQDEDHIGVKQCHPQT